MARIQALDKSISISDLIDMIDFGIYRYSSATPTLAYTTSTKEVK